MLGRFLCALLIVVVVAITGTRLEKRNRELSRRISLQHYRMKVLQREYAQARLRAEQWGAPKRLLPSADSTGPAALAEVPGDVKAR